MVAPVLVGVAEDGDDAAVQQAVQRSADEIKQLKHTSGLIREELESQNFEFEAKYQQQKLENVDEHSHLQETIEKLRLELEKQNG